MPRVVKKPATPRRRSKRSLLPVMRPAQNMREIIKQAIMLEDHLFQRCKRCPDCVNKHFLTIEALAEECGTLCDAGTKAAAADSQEVASKVRVLHHAWAQDPKGDAVCTRVAGQLRGLRKRLMRSYSVLPVDALPSNETQAVRGLLRRRPASRARDPPLRQIAGRPRR